MSDLDLLVQTLTTLNVHHHVERKDDGVAVWLEDPDYSSSRILTKDRTTVPYKGYTGFTWVFQFDLEGKLQNVGGYE